uniref:Tripartite motif-containing protein 2 n=1 Tax=Magallana gigas TaxID=29159 RepID=K1PX25_MAGGI
MDNIFKKLTADVDDMESKDQVVLKKQEVGIKRAISEITKSIADLTKLVNSNDGSLFGSLKTEARDAPGSLIDEPQTITDIKTNYGRLNPLYGVSCLSDEEIWTCGLSRSMKLYNLQGELVKSAKIKSWKVPTDIAVTQTGDLIYTDYNDGTVNMVTDSTVQLVVKLRKWGPCNVSVTSTGDLLVVMDSDDKKQTKVVRYSQTGCNEIQSIQFNDMGQPLFSCGGFYNTKYISENRNLDICVADNGGSAVVVVNQVGKLRFIYTGPPSNAKGSFGPRGIATDSQSRTLIADFNHHSIHILDQDGQFLRYIDNCGLQRSCGVCLDDKDCLFVTELLGNLKKIQYK